MYDETRHTQVRGDAVAVTGGGGTIAIVNLTEELTLNPFQEVPIRQKLTITDVFYYPQLDVTGPYTVNLAEKFPNGTDRILLQLNITPGQVTQAHHHTGHVFGPKSKLVVFTDANGAVGKHISVTLTGYLGPVKRAVVKKKR